MAEQNDATNQDPQGPVFKMQKMFIKDLSFENPNAPDVFMNPNAQPKVEINLGLKNKKIEQEDHYEVLLTVNATVTNSEDDKTLFIVEIEHGGIFFLKNIPEEHLPAVLAVDCPTLLFPFTRQLICQISVDGGFMPFLLDPVNFHALFQNAQQRKQQQDQQQEASPEQ